MSIYHKHHIIPKHMGGSDDPSNLVYVTIEQHANLHKQLWEDLGYWQDRVAWQGLSRMLGKDEIISEVIRRSQSGRKKTQSEIEKIRNARLGKKLSKETKDKMSVRRLGVQKSEATKERMYLATLKKIETGTHPSQNKVVCETCHKQMSRANFLRWNHGENCDR
jgi:hypothetical protein